MFFSAEGTDYMVLTLEFGPRDTVLAWADSIVDAHPRHKVIVNTHCYMYYDNTRLGSGDQWSPHNYAIDKNPGDVNDGEEMWEKFVKKHENIFLVLSGHVLGTGTAYLVSDGDKGNKVYQILTNYQKSVVGSLNGGNGFLRIMTFDPDSQKLLVQTYSPYLDSFQTRRGQEFSFAEAADAFNTGSGLVFGKAGDYTHGLIKAVPNPFSTSVEIEIVRSALYVVRSERTSLAIYNINGRLVYNIPSTTNYEPRTKYTWSPETSPNGIYIIRLKAGEKMITKRITLIR
jgi:hypothetical protein